VPREFAITWKENTAVLILRLHGERYQAYACPSKVALTGRLSPAAKASRRAISSKMNRRNNNIGVPSFILSGAMR
jgi:hypothetical protein